MGVIYDSGWVPVASGTVVASIDTGNLSYVMITVAASGASAASTSGYYIAGAEEVVPYWKGAKLYAGSPRVTGAIAFANPTANTVKNHNFWAGPSGTDWYGPPYSRIVVSSLAGTNGYVRITADGK